jgi:RIO-like serine/threonine protein kinase
MLHRLSDIWKRCYTPQHIRRLANRTSTLGTTYRGINLFDDHDGRIITAINDPSHDLTGFKRSDMLSAIPGLTKHQATYALKRLRAHGLIKKEAKSHRYFPTRLGRQSQTACVALHNLIVLPLLAAS